ncbi:hypothetical protein C5167_051146 [Papaver somniferum]|uniref:Uncharacterized protein n=1 Tax=Papaver somniferum TaxID=3469 RepID=A0A4Y7KQN7_PAPSO|nr:hypothetical protein C5167_051146 [Papaver somniferum]
MEERYIACMLTRSSPKREETSFPIEANTRLYDCSVWYLIRHYSKDQEMKKYTSEIMLSDKYVNVLYGRCLFFSRSKWSIS